MANKNLNAAKTAKKDEFYTQMSDIEMELQHYWQHFRDKVVLCNCDDPYESNFFKYFALHFNHLGLKKLICTCYNGSPIQGDELTLSFDFEDEEPKKIAHKVVITEVKDLNGDGAVDLSYLYDTFHEQTLDIASIEEEISRLMRDSDIQKPLGIIPYVLTRNERHLDLRSFPEDIKLAVWEKQHHICPHCKKEFSFEQMEGDHITPWCEGGRTIESNCQMLCRDCNRRKGSK